MRGLRFHDQAPPDWDERVGSSFLFTGFAAAGEDVGHRAWFVEADDDMALVLVRRVPIPVLGRWTGRAKVYTARRDPGFLRRLADALARRGVVHMVVGDHQHPWEGPWPEPWAHFRREARHTTLIDEVQCSPEAFLARRQVVRKNLGKARRAGVEVVEVTKADEVEAACALIAETSVRIHAQGIHFVYPNEHVRALARHMVPRGQASILIAHAGGQPLCAHIYFLERDRHVYFHGGSTRDRALTPKQGPTAMVWEAMARARARGCKIVELGGVALDTPSQAGLVEFKRQWGRFVVAEVAYVELAPRAVRLQERLLYPAWRYVHPLYIQAFGRRAS
ncbi:MAG TPA: GNAT family N-acetyltransferase [Terriglobales bacterium]|nr:GNAT family N-acetyltransferase [Terriglobales bacterium]